MSNPGTPPPAGWYADPQNPQVQRWWDGNTWTEHAVPLQQPPRLMGSLYNEEKDRAAGKNSAAVWGFVLALVSIPMWALSPILAILVAVAAIVWGSIGLARSKNSGKGFGLALAAVIIGSVQGIGGLALLPFLGLFG